MVSFVIGQRRSNRLLMMLPHHDAVLVNGLLALALTVLAPRDSIVIASGIHSYVTERIRPHVGSPLRRHVGLRCPYCTIAITEETRIAVCRCGVAYHHEPVATDRDRKGGDKERLDCLPNVRACLSCGRPVALEEYLVWDPSTL
jgi:hypothetical protein